MRNKTSPTLIQQREFLQTRPSDRLLTNKTTVDMKCKSHYIKIQINHLNVETVQQQRSYLQVPVKWNLYGHV